MAKKLVTCRYYRIIAVLDNDEEYDYNMMEWGKYISNLSLVDRKLTNPLYNTLGRVENIFEFPDKQTIAFQFMDMNKDSSYRLMENAEAEEIKLRKDEYFGKDTTLLYREDIGIALLQRNRGGMGEGSIKHYLLNLHNFKENIVDLKFKPIEDPFNLPTTFKISFEDFGSKTYGFSKDKGVWGNAATALGYLDTALNVVDGVQDNIQKNETSGIQYAGDAVVDAADGIASMAAGSVGAQIGAALGTAIPIPVVGTIVGAVAGFAIGWVAGKAYDWVTDGLQIGGKTIKEHFKSGVEWISDTAGNWWDSVTGWA